MNRKDDCERIVLTKEEKRLLKSVSRHPHKPIDWNTALPLRNMGLIVEDILGYDDLGQSVGNGTYTVSDFYWVYKAYQTDLKRQLTLQSFWLPVLVSLLTNLAISVLLA